ncbi:MAG: DUF2844 domain-containing protein [Leptospirales bacterium]
MIHRNGETVKTTTGKRTQHSRGHLLSPGGLTLLIALSALMGGEALGPAIARATLGEVEATVSRDREGSAGTHTLLQAQGGVRIHTITSSSRTYREYVTPGGTVFAVTWQGMHPPHLKTVLGAYAAEYREAIVRARTQTNYPAIRSRFLRVTTAHLLIDGGGQPRTLSGRVILPAQIPPGFPVDQIR